MACCSIRWCGKNSRTSNYKTDGITFHRFPKEPVLKEKWIDSTRRENWFPTEFSVVCSRHFTEDCFQTMKYRRRLFKTAIPTRNLPLVGNASVCTERAPENTSPIRKIHNEDHQENPLGDCPASIKEELSDSFESSPSIQCIEASEDAATATTGSSHFSAGYQCDQCREDIVGFRYCCVECANYDLCGACEAVGHHAAHYVLRVPSTKPHVEVQAVLENIRNILFQKEDDGRCELEAEVKVEPPEPAPEPDPLAPAGAGGGFQFQDQTAPLVESTFVPSVKRDDLELEDTELKLELTDNESQETSHSHLVPVATQPTVPPKREARLCDMKVYAGGGGGFTVYTHSADTDASHDAQPAPDPTPQLVPQSSQGVDARKQILLNKGMLVEQTVKKNVRSTAKRKTKAPSLRQAKVKKVI